MGCADHTVCIRLALQNDGTTALFVACQYGHLGAVRSLLGAGASVSQARVSFTCLICFLSEGHWGNDVVVGTCSGLVSAVSVAV